MGSRVLPACKPAGGLSVPRTATKLLVLLSLQCTAAGWSFPWGLRVRLYEMLLRALFDTLDEAEYVQDKDRYLQVLEVRWS